MHPKKVGDFGSEAAVVVYGARHRLSLGYHALLETHTVIVLTEC